MKRSVILWLLLVSVLLGCAGGFDSDGNGVVDTKETLTPNNLRELQQIVHYYLFTEPNDHIEGVPKEERVTAKMVENRKKSFANLDINIEKVKDLSFLFALPNAENTFNGAIEDWDTSSVSLMLGTFAGAKSFNQNISTWDVGNVTDMEMMFADAEKFNQPIGSWDTRNVTLMGNMFRNAYSFNQDVSDWDISNVTDMSGMFAGAVEFEQNLSSWNVLGKRAEDMFASTAMEYKLDWHPSGCACGVGDHIIEFDFNENNIDDRYEVFDFNKKSDLEQLVTYYFFTEDGKQSRKAEVFDSLSMSIHSITDMSGLFDVDSYHSSFWSDYSGGNFFNGDISSWNVSKVGTMESLFSGAERFNQDISNWNVSNVTNMSNMFDSAIDFNQDISDWDISNVTTMKNMFRGATSFYQDLSRWDATRINTSNMFLGTPMQDAYEWHPIGCNCGIEYDLDDNGLDDRREPVVMIKDSESLERFVSFYIFPRYFGLSTDEKIKRAEAFDIIEFDTTNVRDMSGLFRNPGYQEESMFNSDISRWDVSQVVDMHEMFYMTKEFNQDISSWDVASVTNMNHMFYDADAFNGDLRNWNVGKVASMKSLFCETDLFNQDISGWDVSNVTNMEYMFYGAGSFNQDISSWDISNVVSMKEMFKNSKAFYQDLSGWDVTGINTEDMFLGSLMQDTYEWHPKGCNCGMELDGNRNGIDDRLEDSLVMRDRQDLKYFVDYYQFPSYVSSEEVKKRAEIFPLLPVDTQAVWNMNSLFAQPSTMMGENRFNGDISGWDVSGATTMWGLFRNLRYFNCDIGGWDVSNVTNMEYLLENAIVFNQDISNWDVSSVTHMEGLFRNATMFNQDISNWDVSRVTNMRYMFQGARFFNQDISDWDLSSVTDVREMFNNATSLYQDLSGWDVSGKWTQGMFSGTPMETKVEWHPVGCNCSYRYHN